MSFPAAHLDLAANPIHGDLAGTVLAEHFFRKRVEAFSPPQAGRGLLVIDLVRRYVHVHRDIIWPHPTRFHVLRRLGFKGASTAPNHGVAILMLESNIPSAREQMITDIVDCQPDEIRRHVEYLGQTPVWRMANLLFNGYVLKRAAITSVRYLGSMRTEFGNLGPFTSQATFGAEKFLVRQVLPTLLRVRAPGVSTQQALESIRYFIGIDNEGDLEPLLRVTLLGDASGLTIKNGCKRTVAFYESRNSLEADEIDFPVYLISSRASASLGLP